MGCSPFKNCSTNYAAVAPAPNPDPSRWTLINKYKYAHGYVLIVKYLDCTNFDGVKVMVYRGKYSRKNKLDPHFTDDKNSPIARFRPDAEGIEMAKVLAKEL